MEKILKIEETQHNVRGYIYEGYKITTDKQEIFMLISSYQQCCESWGYLISEDDTQSFVGSNLISVEVVDSALNSKIVQAVNDCNDDYVNTLFVNVSTSAGILQFTAYNSHNGYYGHEVTIISDQLNHTDSL
jgi:hypothetical protein